MTDAVTLPREQLEAAYNYIMHCGANAIMRGEPHPQQQIVEWLETALASKPLNPEADRRKTLNDVIYVLRDRWLGNGFPGGGISDLDDIDHDTVRLCIAAVVKLQEKNE
jgi:hypothetical protein